MTAQAPSLFSRISRGLAVAASLTGLLTSGSLLLGEIPELSVKALLIGILMLSLLLYGWAEAIHERPLFLLVPGVWLVFSLAGGIGSKGEGLLFALPVMIAVSAVIRSRYARKAAVRG